MLRQSFSQGKDDLSVFNLFKLTTGDQGRCSSSGKRNLKNVDNKHYYQPVSKKYTNQMWSLENYSNTYIHTY